MLTVGSLFSGIGGLDLGLERAGMKVLWQVEKDPYARRVLAKHWPDVPCYDDVRNVRGSETSGREELRPWERVAERVDLICGGFPCQDISVAGKGAGIKEGTRSGLWLEFARIVRELRPRYVLVENVPALRSRGLDRVLGDLAACGYDAEWDVLPAATFGAPHLRERLFVVAYTQRELVRQQPGRSRGPHREDSVLFTGDGPKGSAPWAPRGAPESYVRGVDDGAGSDVDRLRCLGNAVVPQVAEFVGRLIVAHHGHSGADG
jgi:DNA (cytosine-5)-methyltransferase 1